MNTISSLRNRVSLVICRPLLLVALVLSAGACGGQSPITESAGSGTQTSADPDVAYPGTPATEGADPDPANPNGSGATSPKPPATRGIGPGPASSNGSGATSPKPPVIKKTEPEKPPAPEGTGPEKPPPPVSNQTTVQIPRLPVGSGDSPEKIGAPYCVGINWTAGEIPSDFSVAITGTNINPSSVIKHAATGCDKSPSCNSYVFRSSADKCYVTVILLVYSSDERTEQASLSLVGKVTCPTEKKVACEEFATSIADKAFPITMSAPVDPDPPAPAKPDQPAPAKPDQPAPADPDPPAPADPDPPAPAEPDQPPLEQPPPGDTDQSAPDPSSAPAA
jgi:hypothetical protein